MQLSQESLHKIVFAAFVMAAVDGYMDDEEIEVIQTFTSEHWSNDFGARDEFFRKIDEEVVEFFKPVALEGLTRDHADKFFNNLLPHLGPVERQHLVELMTEVMQADQILETEELELLERLKKEL